METSGRSRPSRLLPLRLGTRGSALALAQARWVAERLQDDVELVEISTQGADGDKSRFEKAINVRAVISPLCSAVSIPSAIATSRSSWSTNH